MSSKSEQKVIRDYLASIGKRGGKKSKRNLSPAAARQMVLVREARKAFKKYYFECFWSFEPDLIVTKHDVIWVAEQLMKHGSRACWKVGRSLCQ
ncbi:MAG: hypothetical protein NT027_07755 [Proteobacteria bacterium]|nr:hypothetical protein [Pseudomonadota bacterium]